MTSPVNLIAHLLDLFDFLPLSNRNYIVDGNFERWVSASATITSISNAAATMYYSDPGTGGTAIVTQNSFALGVEPVGMTSPVAYYLKHNQSVASSGTPLMAQRVESVRTLQGRSVTFSCWLWCDSGTLTIPTVSLNQNFGTGGSPSSTVVTSAAVNWAVTTTPQRFSMRLDLPSITGKTLGSGGNDYLNTILYLPVGATFALNTAQWQLEQCSPQAPAVGLPTAFEYRGLGPEQARAARYYQAVACTDAGYATASSALSHQFSPSSGAMRAAPSVALSGTTTSNCSIASGGASATGMLINPTVTATGTYSFTTTATLDARL